MDWLKKILGDNPIVALLIPSSLSALTFLGNLVLALSDGVIDDTEFHQLAASANGIEMLALIAIMFILKSRKDKKP